MHAFDWLEKQTKLGAIFSLHMLPDCLGTLSSTLCQISALKEAIGQYIYDISIFLKLGILNVPFLFNICTILFLSCYDIGCTMFR